jgi:hypothetical protein
MPCASLGRTIGTVRRGRIEGCGSSVGEGTTRHLVAYNGLTRELAGITGLFWSRCFRRGCFKLIGNEMLECVANAALSLQILKAALQSRTPGRWREVVVTDSWAGETGINSCMRGECEIWLWV